MLTDKKILVVGGAGYIGAHVVQALCDKNFEVLVFDNFSTGQAKNINVKAQIIEGDILKKDDLKRAFDGDIGVVFHFAALKAAGDSMIHPEEFAKNNICGSLNLMEAALKRGVKSLVFSSSAAVYGTPEEIPIGENHTLNPDNYYGYTKIAIEENLRWMSKLKGLKYAALRYFNATGYDLSGRIKLPEKNPANLCPIIMEAAAGMRDKVLIFGNDFPTPDGTGVRDYIHVEDLVSAHILAMNYIINNKKDITVNLGTGKGYSVLEMIKAAEAATGKTIPFEIVDRRKGDPAALTAGCDLARRELKWEAWNSDLNTIFKSMCPVYL